jgi:tight adherence protein C
MSLAMLLGAGMGAGVVMIARGLWPPRASLANALAAPHGIRTPGAVTPSASTPGILARIGRPLVRALGSRQLTAAWSAGHRSVVAKTAEAHLAEKLICALLGFLLVPLVIALLELGGVDLPLFLAPWPALLLATAGFFVPDFAVRSEGAKRRREMRYALSAFIDLTCVALAGGSGIESALRTAAAVGDGRAFKAIGDTLERARLTRETPWAALARLGQDMGVPELEETAASVGLSGTEGARVRQSLAARAASLREHRRCDAEAEARVATQRMTVTLVLLLVGFLAFVLFPAYVRVFSSL